MKRKQFSSYLARIICVPPLLLTQGVGHSALLITRTSPPQSCVAPRMLHVFLLLQMDSSPLPPPPDIASWLFKLGCTDSVGCLMALYQMLLLVLLSATGRFKMCIPKNGGGGKCHHIPFSFRAFWNWTYVVCLNVVLLACMLSYETHFLNHYYERCKSCIKSVIDCTYVLWFCILWGS